jgi:hypothetical protein
LIAGSKNSNATFSHFNLQMASPRRWINDLSCAYISNTHCPTCILDFSSPSDKFNFFHFKNLSGVVHVRNQPWRGDSQVRVWPPQGEGGCAPGRSLPRAVCPCATHWCWRSHGDRDVTIGGSFSLCIPTAPLTIALTPQKPNVSPPHRQGASTLDLYTPALGAWFAQSAHQDFRVTHRDRLPFRRGRYAKDAPQTTDRGKSRRPPAFRRIDPFSYLFEACKFIKARSRMPLLKTKTLVHKLTIKKGKNNVTLKLGN